MDRLICIFLFFISAALFAGQATTTEQIMGMVDAGSSGSRLHIFSYQLDEQGHVQQLKELWSRKIMPGLASIYSSQQDIDDYLDRLFVEVPVKPLRLRIYATAGMRLLPKPLQYRQFALVKKWFDQHPDYQLEEARTISGVEEGLFAWMSVNQSLNRFAGSGDPVATLDIGGASVQIVFPVADDEELNSDDKIYLDIYGRHYALFIHSFLGLGQTELTHQFLDDKSCFPVGYKMPAGRSASGNIRLCSQHVETLVNKIHRVADQIAPTLSQHPVREWVAIGGLATVLHGDIYNTIPKPFTLQSLYDTANVQACQQSWKTMKARYPHNTFLYDYCLLPAAYYALIVKGYGVPANQPIELLAKDNFIDWTSGAVMYAAIKSA